MEMGACLSPALIPSGSSDCLTSILGFSLSSKGEAANTMASPAAFELYEAARDAECGWSSPRPANLLTAPGDVVLRDQWRQ